VDEGTVKLTVASVLPATAVTFVGDPGNVNTGTTTDTQGTPAQFSNAAFFQRTLISSRLNEALRFISLGEISLVNNSPIGFPPFEFTCAKQITGNNSNAKILNII
jgi:hypothetical protein